VKDVPVDAALLGEAVIRQRPVDGVDDVIARAQRFQGGLGAFGDKPASGLHLGREAIPLQALRPVD
jgi:hypothetical protein